MNKNLLTILRCPVTHKGLSMMKKDALNSLNTAIAEGEVRNRNGHPVTEPFREALGTDDGKLGYPIADGIPVLLEGEAIQLARSD